MKKKPCKPIFTMIEMVVVVLIIAVLAAVATPMYMNYLKDARVTSAKAQIELFDQALLDYSIKMGKLPDTDPGLEALVRNTTNDPRWRKVLKGDSVPLDPWGNPYVYRNLGGNEYEIISYGADGKAGGDEDNADLSNRSTSGN